MRSNPPWKRAGSYNPRLQRLTRRGSLLVYCSLLAAVVLFFYKPLFSSAYVFPWDFRGVQLPLITFLRDQLRENRFALWNPYNYGGYPIYANIQACFFHPLVFASALISSRLSWYSLPLLLEWIVVLQVWIGGVAAYYLFRNIGLGSAPAWTGAVMFETGSYFASRAEHIDSMMAAVWMPLAWLAVWKLAHWEKLRADWLVVLSVALGLSIWGGFPQATVAVFGSTVVFAMFLAALRMARPVVIAWACCGCIFGILLAAVPFIPTAQLTEYSVAKYRVDWLGTGGGLYWQSLVSLVLPDHYNIFDIAHFKGPWDPTFLYLYSSILGLLLAIFALLARRTRITALFGLLLFFGMFWMLGDKTIIWRKLFPLLPEQIRIGIHPEYTYCIFSLAIAGLAAIGLDAMRVANGMRWAIGVLIALDLFLVGSGRPMNVSAIKVDPGVTRDTFDGSAPLLDAVRERVNQNFPPWRYDTVHASPEWTYGAPILQIPSAAGISPMAPENAVQIRLFLHDGNRAGWNYPLEHINSPVVDLMNVKYLISGGQEISPLTRLPKFRLIASLPGNNLFENTDAFPRFFLVHDIRAATSLDNARRLMQQADLRNTAIVDTPLQLPSDRSDAYNSDQVKPLQYQPTELEVVTQSARGSLLVLSETDYPGWKAWVDDRPAPIYSTDIALRGVIVPAGAHRVRMEFRPLIFPISLAISLVTAIALAITAFLYRRSARSIQLESNGK